MPCRGFLGCSCTLLDSMDSHVVCHLTDTTVRCPSLPSNRPHPGPFESNRLITEGTVLRRAAAETAWQLETNSASLHPSFPRNQSWHSHRTRGALLGTRHPKPRMATNAESCRLPSHPPRKRGMRSWSPTGARDGASSKSRATNPAAGRQARTVLLPPRVQQ